MKTPGLNNKILEMVSTPEGTKYFFAIQAEMYKIIKELYWQDDPEGKELLTFVNDFFQQYEFYLTYTKDEIIEWRSR